MSTSNGSSRQAFVLVPGGTTHDFENRSAQRAGVLNFSIPGGFKPHVPGIAQWFADNPPPQTESPAP